MEVDVAILSGYVLAMVFLVATIVITMCDSLRKRDSAGGEG